MQSAERADLVRRVLSRWDGYLRASGLPAEPPDWGHTVPLFNPVPDEIHAEIETAPPLADTPRAAWWRGLTHLVEALPPNYTRRPLLIRWVESGNLEGSARALGLTKRQALTTVQRFARHVTRARSDARQV